MKKQKTKTDVEKTFLTVGEISKRSGIAISALHFYESKGLLRTTRNAANQRLIHRRELRILSYIKVSQKIGLTLDEIGEVFKSIKDKEELKASDWNKLAKSLDRVLTERLELIQRMKNQLQLCIGCGCLSLQDCPLRNPEDKLAKKGSGAHLLGI